MRRGAPLLWVSLTLALTAACKDEHEQRFPFTYEELDAGPRAPPPPDAVVAEDAGVDGDAGADVVLVDAAEAAEEDASALDAALDEGLVEDDAGDGELLDAGEDITTTAEAGAPTSEPLEEGAGGTRDEELFGGDDGAEGEEAPFGADGDAGAAPGGGIPPGVVGRGPIRFPPIPPGGVAPMPLYPGESFDVATLSGGYTAVVMKNIALRIDEDVNVFVVSLTGALVPVATDLVDLDQPGRLQIVVDEAEVRISEEDLERLFSRYLFEEDDDFGDDFGEGPESPLRDVEVTLERGRVVLKAELEEGGDDVELRGTLEPTVSGDVALIPTALRRDEKPVDALDDIFEEGVGATSFGDDDLGAGFANVSAGPALWLDEDAIYFDPEAILRAPALDADVIDVKTSGKYVRLLLEGNAPEVKTLGPPGDPENYVEMRGGAVRFGKVVMPRADLLFLDADPSDPLDLSLHRFDEQVIAGETRMRPDLGLESTLPDFDEIDESAFEVPDEDEAADDDEDGGTDEDGGDGDAGIDEDDVGDDDAGRDENIFE